MKLTLNCRTVNGMENTEEYEIETKKNGFYFDDIADHQSAYCDYHEITPEELETEIQFSDEDAENLTELGYKVRKHYDTENASNRRIGSTWYTVEA